MTWDEVKTTINRIANIPVLTVDSCAKALNCEFDEISPGRFMAERSNELFNLIEICIGRRKVIVILRICPTREREQYYQMVNSLGEPDDIEIVSPPMASDNGLASDFGWERKYSMAYKEGNNMIWFGIEEKNLQHKLVSVAIHRDR